MMIVPEHNQDIYDILSVGLVIVETIIKQIGHVMWQECGTPVAKKKKQTLKG